VLSDFQRMVRLEGDRHRAIIESATPLADDLRKDVATNLTRMYGTGLDTSFEENPALIAGMRIQVGSDVYDGSVRGRLASIDAGLSE
jgi:F-type H+-transporting ATPase subunit delta